MKVQTAIHKKKVGFNGDRVQFIWLKDGRVYKRRLSDIWMDNHRSMWGGIDAGEWEAVEPPITWNDRDFGELIVEKHPIPDVKRVATIQLDILSPRSGYNERVWGKLRALIIVKNEMGKTIGNKYLFYPPELITEISEHLQKNGFDSGVVAYKKGVLDAQYFDKDDVQLEETLNILETFADQELKWTS